MDNVFVKMCDLPGTVHSFVIAHPDQTYTIVLNSRLSHEQHLLSYQHELDHINNGDYDKKCSVDLIELYSHR